MGTLLPTPMVTPSATNTSIAVSCDAVFETVRTEMLNLPNGFCTFLMRPCSWSRRKLDLGLTNPCCAYRNVDFATCSEFFLRAKFQTCRFPRSRYDWSKYTRGTVYGVPTPHSNEGKNTSLSLKWIHDLNT